MVFRYVEDLLDISEVSWKDESAREQLTAIRRVVFIIGQSVPEKREMDGEDKDCWHFLVKYNKIPIGTCRVLPDGHIGRMAILEEYRGHGIGGKLLEYVKSDAKTRLTGIRELILNSQTHAVGFYEKHGFRVDESVPEFMDAGIPHRKMHFKVH